MKHDDLPARERTPALELHPAPGRVRRILNFLARALAVALVRRAIGRVLEWVLAVLL